MSVQRWKPNKATERYWSEGMRFDADGAYVTYADHVAALAEAEQRHPGIPIQGEHYPLCFPAIRDVRIGEWGPLCFTCEVISMVRAEALRQAREVVAGLPWKVAVSFGPIDCDESCEHGPCTCSGVMRPEAWMTGPADALAAIDALAAGQAPAAPGEVT